MNNIWKKYFKIGNVTYPQLGWWLYNETGRENGCYRFKCGYECWYKNGELHREDGPAVIYVDGTEVWYKNGKKHREGGPAYVDPITKDKKYYRNGLLHGEDGPAVIYPGVKRWYKNGTPYYIRKGGNKSKWFHVGKEHLK